MLIMQYHSNDNHGKLFRAIGGLPMQNEYINGVKPKMYNGTCGDWRGKAPPTTDENGVHACQNPASAAN